MPLDPDFKLCMEAAASKAKFSFSKQMLLQQHLQLQIKLLCLLVIKNLMLYWG
jgi:hypothetical protein